MSGPWNDFNSAQSNTTVIPKGTLAKVRLTLRPGGFDELGVLVFGHKKNAYWHGSKLGIEEARALAPYQNPTAMQ
ncbi:MAG: hypothetical protein HC834_04730, partial [Rhodospirillales bacterium]|nr:hypothetical protein [Rhodospirillales bacterium]